MADPIAGLDIDDARKDEVREIVAKAQRDAEKAATSEAKKQFEKQFELAKVDFRAGVAGSRRPEQFDPATMHIASYFDNFEPFRSIMNLDGSQAVNTFLTYLSPKALDTLIAQDVVHETNWKSFKNKAIDALKSPREAVQARYELKKAKQRGDETVAQFGERLIKLGRLGYTQSESRVMESILKDALSGGVLRDEIAIVLINKQDDDFKDCLEEAVRLDTAYRARSTLKDEDNLHVSILKNEISPANDYCYPYSGHESPLSQPVERINSASAPRNLPNGTRSQSVGVMPTQGVPQGTAENPQAFLTNHSYQQSPHAVINRQYAQYSPDSNPNVTCYACNMQGHFASSCPNRSRGYAPRGIASGQRRNRPNVSCYYCGILGHVARECRKRMSDERHASYNQSPHVQYQSTRYHDQEYQANNSDRYTPHEVSHQYQMSNGPHRTQQSRNTFNMSQQQAQPIQPTSALDTRQPVRNHVASSMHATANNFSAQSSSSTSQIPKN